MSVWVPLKGKWRQVRETEKAVLLINEEKEKLWIPLRAYSAWTTEWGDWAMRGWLKVNVAKWLVEISPEVRRYAELDKEFRSSLPYPEI